MFAKTLRMRIRFSEHITLGHREGILSELAGMGASSEQVDEDTFIISVPKVRSYPFVYDFLSNEQRVGNLELDES